MRAASSGWGCPAGQRGPSRPAPSSSSAIGTGASTPAARARPASHRAAFVSAAEAISPARRGGSGRSGRCRRRGRRASSRPGPRTAVASSGRTGAGERLAKYRWMPRCEATTQRAWAWRMLTPPRCTTSAAGQNHDSHPAASARAHQSIPSQSSGKRSSCGPISATARAAHRVAGLEPVADPALRRRGPSRPTRTRSSSLSTARARRRVTWRPSSASRDRRQVAGARLRACRRGARGGRRRTRRGGGARGSRGARRRRRRGTRHRGC